MWIVVLTDPALLEQRHKWGWVLGFMTLGVVVARAALDLVIGLYTYEAYK